MLKGSYVALVTPFYSNGEVNYDKLTELLEYHIANKTDGVVILGTTGEATTISLEEQKKIVKHSLEVVHHRIPVMVGAGSNDTAKSMELAKEFSTMGADYLLVITPYYNKTNTSGLIKHFEAIAEVSTCPIVLYNVPSRTNMSIPVEVVKKLSENKKIGGIKEASGNISYASKISKYLSDSFVMLSGNDDIIVPMMSIGSVGVISVVANICPTKIHEICHLCAENKYGQAQKNSNDLSDLISALFLETNPIPIKEAMNEIGFEVGGFHLPLDNMSFNQKEILLSAIKTTKGVQKL